MDDHAAAAAAVPEQAAEPSAVQEECPLTPPMAPLIEMDDAEEAKGAAGDAAAVAAPETPRQVETEEPAAPANGVAPLNPAALGTTARTSPSDTQSTGGQSAAVEDQCHNCGNVKANLRKCPCLLVSYCDSHCQKSHWEQHRVLCTSVRRQGGATATAAGASAPNTPSRFTAMGGAGTPLKQPTPNRNGGTHSPMMTSPMAGGGFPQGAGFENPAHSAAMHGTLNPKHLLDGFERVANFAPKTASRILLEMIKTNPTILYPAAVTMVKAGLSQIDADLAAASQHSQRGANGFGQPKPFSDPVSPFSNRHPHGNINGGNMLRAKNNGAPLGGNGFGAPRGGAGQPFGNGNGFGSLSNGANGDDAAGLGGIGFGNGGQAEGMCMQHQTHRSRKHLQWSPLLEGWTCKPGLHCLSAAEGRAERRTGSPLLKTSSPQPLMHTPDRRSEQADTTPMKLAMNALDFDPNDSVASSIASAILADD